VFNVKMYFNGRSLIVTCAHYFLCTSIYMLYCYSLSIRWFVV